MSQNIRTLQPGEFLCQQGEDSNEIYVLRAGALHVYVVDADGVVPQDRVKEEGMLVGEVKEVGAFIGEIGAILNEKRSASMMASPDGPVQVMVINLRGQGFAQTVVGNPKIGFGLSKTIAQRIGASCNNITKSDALSLKAKTAMEAYAQDIYQMTAALDAEAKKQEKDVAVIKDLKATRAYQVGRMIDKYGAVPLDMYSALGLNYVLHPENFENRTLAAEVAAQAAALEAPEPQGPPKPGVTAFEPGSVVCPEKSVDENLYILLGGKLELFVGMRGLETIKMKGDIFGENAMFGNMERSTGIRALTAVHAMPVPKGSIEAFLMKKPPVMVHVLRSFARRLPLLNDTLLKTAHQMTQVMNLLGHGVDGCMTVLETFVPRIKEEAAAALGEGASSAVHKAESLLSEITTEFEEINNNYVALCAEIGYKPRDVEKKAGMGKLAPPKFDFATKVEQLDLLEVEHVNFVLNPKKDQFRACAIEFDHDSLMKQAKVPDAMKNDYIYGRIHNIGESFPTQFITLDMSNGGKANFDREYALRALQFIIGSSEHEAAMLFRDNHCVEIMYIPDHIKMEDDVADEATINAIMEAFRKKPDDRDNLEKLNGLFWDLAISNIQKKLTKVKDNEIPFEDADLKLINYGLLDEKLLPDNSNVLAQISEDLGFTPPESQGLQYISVTDSMQDVYKEAFGYNKSLKLQEEQKKAEEALERCRERIKTITQGRKDMISTFPGGAGAAAFVQKLDGLILATASLEMKMRAGRSISNEERAKIGQIKNAKTALVNQVNSFLTTVKGKVSDDQIKQFSDLGAELDKRVIEELGLIEIVSKKVEIVKNHENEMRLVTIKQKENTYKNEIIRIKKYILLAAKKCKVDAISVLVNVRDIASKKRVSEVIDLFMQENVDPEIFDPRLQRVKQLGNPKVMLVPGSGNALYDWEKHVFLVPLIAPKSLEESIANAFVEFHWDMDEDKSLRESYGELKIYKKLTITKLKQQLIKDYVIWATQESKGWKKLDKEARTWFQVKIAHQKVGE